VGLGFHQGHLTLETVTTIVRAEKLLYGGNGAGTWLRELNPSAEDVDIYRADGTARSRVVAFYGSASTAVYPAAVAYRRAKAEGYEARMLPAISTAEMLFCGPRHSPQSCQMAVLNPRAFPIAEPDLFKKK